MYITNAVHGTHIAKLAALRMMRAMTTSDPKTERVQLLISKPELDAVDDWMFAHRLRSRSEAIRRLIQMGLDAETKDGPPDEGGPR